MTRKEIDSILEKLTPTEDEKNAEDKRYESWRKIDGEINQKYWELMIAAEDAGDYQEKKRVLTEFNKLREENNKKYGY